MLQALAGLFDALFVAVVRLTLDAVAPLAVAEKGAGDPALPDSQTLIAHFAAQRSAGHAAPTERRSSAPPPAAQPQQLSQTPVPANPSVVEPAAVSPPPHAASPEPPMPAASAATQIVPSGAAPSVPQPPPTTAAAPVPPAAPSPQLVAADSGQPNVRIDRDRFDALGLTTKPPEARALSELPASPVRHGVLDPALAHEFASARAASDPVGTEPVSDAAHPLSPARSGTTNEREVQALQLPHERPPDSLAAPWARLPSSPVVAPPSATPAASHSPTQPVATPSPSSTSSPATTPPETWPELPAWPLDWDEPAFVPSTRLSERESAWYV
ncbi:MAG TPA: hypothetical protein VGF86_15445 [Candidatus Tumulicola sp.]|jgi:hypothetical protein